MRYLQKTENRSAKKDKFKHFLYETCKTRHVSNCSTLKLNACFKSRRQIWSRRPVKWLRLMNSTEKEYLLLYILIFLQKTTFFDNISISRSNSNGICRHAKYLRIWAINPVYMFHWDFFQTSRYCKKSIISNSPELKSHKI